MNLICCMIFFLVQLLVFIAVTAFNKRGPHGRLVFTKCVLPSVNKVYYYYFIISSRFSQTNFYSQFSLMLCF